MVDITQLTNNHSIDELRAALYFVGRYVKQAGILNNYQKDIFDDQQMSSPSQTIRTLALEIISEIEKQEKDEVKNLEHYRVVEILDEITAIEDSLVPDLSPAEIESAELFNDGMELPKESL